MRSRAGRISSRNSAYSDLRSRKGTFICAAPAARTKTVLHGSRLHKGARLYSGSGNKFLLLRGRGMVLGYGDRALALPEKVRCPATGQNGYAGETSPFSNYSCI